MVEDLFLDLDDASGEMWATSLRCVNCPERIVYLLPATSLQRELSIASLTDVEGCLLAEHVSCHFAP